MSHHCPYGGSQIPLLRLLLVSLLSLPCRRARPASRSARRVALPSDTVDSDFKSGDIAMSASEPMLLSQRIVQICLFLVAAIAIFGGTLQMYLGQPETSPRLDNVHRFMGGIYLMSGVTGLWVATTIRQHNTLIFLLAFTVLLGGIGRLISISKVGLPEPSAVWLGYLVPELVLPWIIIAAQIVTNRAIGGSST